MSKSEKFWDRAAKRFEGQMNEDDKAAIVTLDLTRKYLQSSDIVLDFACAAGKYALEIAPQVKEVWGIDISGEMINAAKRNATDRGIANVQFMQTEINDPRLDDETFNVVLAYNILHLVEEPPRVVAKIKELLRPNGIFISVTPCLGAGGSIQTAFIKLMSLLGFVPKIHSFKSNEVEGLITNAHFDHLETQILSDSIPNVFLVARRKTS
jgi:2-polyprenyl-3-methyl-5-hydroxy-6-metoxy-1,4-benzoquinol methylase